MTSVKEKLDKTIIAICDYIEKLSARNVDETAGICITELSKALATLTAARAFLETLF